jgi:PAS domain S-box-containing protein
VEQALHASEARYRLLAENGNDMVIRVSLTGEYLYASPSSFNLLGYKSEELVGQLGFGMLHPEDVLRAQVALQEALAEEIFEQPITLRLRHKAGHYLWVDLSGRVIFHECSREPLELVATLRDVSERIQSAERLREERDFLQLVIDHVPDIIIVKDANGYLQLANEPTARLYNTTVAAMIGKTDEGFTADRAAIAAIRQQDQATLASGQPLLIAEEPVLLRYFQTTKIPLKNKNGAFDRLLVVASDITDRKVATEALREQRDFLQLVIDSVPALITVKGYDGMLYLINRRLAALYGLTPDEMIGQRDDAIPNTRVPIVVHRAEDQAVITSGQPLFVAEEKVHQRYYQKSKIPFQNADGHYDRVLMIATEITERKAAEEALEQALQKEKELGELKSRFISMASHEFRTPLTAIRATADTLLAYRHKLTEEQIAKRLVKIQDQVVYLTSIIEDVLQLTRLQVGAAALEPVGIDLDALCKLIIDELRSQRADLQRLVYHCDEALHVVMLDKKLMRHIITNLLSNAFKYSPGGEPVFLTLAHTGQALAITVRDAGIGIPERDLAYLFQPFHRAANVGNIPGSGLGLVITKESVELQGGTLTVASKVDVGTTFTVDIPLIAPHSTESEGVS